MARLPTRERPRRIRRVDLRKVLFVLPNLFTLASIFCGFYALVICAGTPSDEDFYRAALLIVLAMFFDTIDGRVARLTHTQSAFGVQIDSLADVVSFGAAPALLVHRWALAPLGMGGAFICFCFLACGAIRLARFNVLASATDGTPKKPGKYIMGLPIPGAAGILVLIVVANHTVAGNLPGSPAIVAAVMLLLSGFMVSTIPFRSFKDVKLNLRTGLFLAVVFGSGAAISAKYHVSFALLWLLACYLVMGVIESAIQISRKIRHIPEERTSSPPTPPQV